MATPSKVIASGTEQRRGQHETVRGQEAVTAQVRAASVRARTRVQAADHGTTRRRGSERFHGE